MIKLPSLEKLKDGKTSFSKSSWFGRHPWLIPERDVIPGPVQMLEYPSMRDAEMKLMNDFANEYGRFNGHHSSATRSNFQATDAQHLPRNRKQTT
ncbi:unnamed protein product [Clavelina lepadiformis]|uniref:Uncharacterized protein n=1 Tax=Clavelina lepadiformis TaxID=159417 RepID=A0ABP0FJC2_CLALP